jgi:hypothetical protein
MPLLALVRKGAGSPESDILLRRGRKPGIGFTNTVKRYFKSEVLKLASMSCGVLLG